jgi:phage terminase large subunit-like protein
LWPTEGAVACQWIEDNCICGEGDWYGKPMRLRQDQQAFIYRWYEYCPECQRWHFEEALKGAATGDGKTGLIAALAVLEFAGPPQLTVPSPIIPIAAASDKQADLLFGVVQTMCGGENQSVKESPLVGFFEVYESEISFADGRPGHINRIASVGGTNEGGLPSLFICDELHEWGDVGDRKARVHTVVGKSTTKRRTPRGPGRILNLSTAGFDRKRSLLGAMYERGVKARRRPDTAPRFLMDWREAPDGLDFRRRDHRERAVRAASGAADVLWSVKDRVDKWGTPSMPAHEWIRYFANKWVDVTDDSWLKEHPGAWKRCEGVWESDPANPFVITVDMALKRDSVAVDRVEKLPDGRFAVTAKIWRPPPGGRIDHLDVFNYVIDEAVGSGFRGVIYDPRFFELPGRMLEDRGIEVIQFDQTPERMSPACGLAFDLIVGQQIVQDGDEEFASHVNAAVKRVQERGFTLSKGKSKQQIDAAVAMCMGLRVLHEPEEEAAEPWFFFA